MRRNRRKTLNKKVSPRQALVSLAAWLAICLAAAWLGSRFSPDPWYAQLTKPVLVPPDWVFPPVWTALYLLMAVAAWQVWQRRALAGATPALGLFMVQLALNAAWPWIFFGLQRPGLAFAEIVALWLAIFATFLAFRRHSPRAGLLLAPYLLWATFAAWLNFWLWRLNP